MFLVRRKVGRADIESPIKDVVALTSVRELPAFIQEHCGKLPLTLGLELDIL